MAANVTQIPGATEIQFFNRNYPYSTALTDLAKLSIILFSDLNVMGFTDAVPNLKKILCDASGSSQTASERVFFADSNGAADSSSNLTFDGSELYVQGEQVSHGSSNELTLTNGGHTAVISLSSSGVLSISLDGIEQANYSNGGPD